MKSLNLSGISLSLLLLSACSSTTAPEQATTNTPEVSTESVPSSTSDVIHALAFPENWKAIPGECGANIYCVFSPETYTGANEMVDHDVFYIHPTSPDTCDETFAKAKANADGNDTPRPFVIDGKNIGYQWMGYAGAGVTPGAPYNMRFVCIHDAISGGDIELSSFSADKKTTDYLDSQFIPFLVKKD